MNVYDFTVKDNKGNDVSLSEYKGKVLLIVNTATKCGLTPQHEGLESLYEKYHDQGFEILDFPCNQFAFIACWKDEEAMKIHGASEHFTRIFPMLSEMAESSGPNDLYKEVEF